MSDHVISTASIMSWKKLRASDALAEPNLYDLSFAPLFIRLAAECGDYIFLQRADKLLAEHDPDASDIFRCLEAFVDQRDALGDPVMDKKCSELTNILKDRALFGNWATKDLKRVAKIGHVLGETWSAWFLRSLPASDLSSNHSMTFLEEAGDRSWWTRPILLKFFRVKFIKPMIKIARHLRKKKGYAHELKNRAQLTKLLNSLRSLDLEQDAEMLLSCMSCW